MPQNQQKLATTKLDIRQPWRSETMICDGVQVRLPQNISLWYIDYFVLKLCKKNKKQKTNQYKKDPPESKKQISHI